MFCVYKFKPKAIESDENIERNYIEVFNSDGTMNKIETSVLNANETFTRNIQEYEEFETVKVLDSGKPDENSIVLVFMGDGFTVDEQNIFLEEVNKLTNNLFGNYEENIKGIYPFNLFKEFATVYAVKVISNESGVSRDGDSNNGVIVDNYFGSSYYNGSNWSTDTRLLVISQSDKVNYYRNNQLGIVLCNSERRGATSSGFYLTISMNEKNIESLAHELGHSIGYLGDEYYEPTGVFRGNEGYPNMTKNSDINTVKWKHLIGYNGVLENVGLKRACPYS